MRKSGRSGNLHVARVIIQPRQAGLPIEGSPATCCGCNLLYGGERLVVAYVSCG